MNEIHFDDSCILQPLPPGFHSFSFSLVKEDSRRIRFHYNGEYRAARFAALQQAARVGCKLVRLEEY